MLQGFPGGTVLTQAGDPRDAHSDPGVRKIPWSRKSQPAPVFCLGENKSHGQRSLAGYSPWGREKSDTAEHSTHSLLQTPRLGGRSHAASVEKGRVEAQALPMQGIKGGRGSVMQTIMGDRMFSGWRGRNGAGGIHETP